MDRLDFHTRVLGKKAAERLRNLNGEFLTLRSKLPEDMVFDVYLDDKRLGRAKIEDLYEDKISLDNLDLSLATLGGFDTVEEQQQALRRAGYHFKLLSQYSAYPIFFVGFWGK